jgi:hypothetical protein
LNDAVFDFPSRTDGEPRLDLRVALPARDLPGRPARARAAADVLARGKVTRVRLDADLRPPAKHLRHRFAQVAE